MPLEALKIENDEGSANATLVVSEFKVITAPSFEDTKSDQEFKDILLNHYCEAPEFEKGIDGPKRC
jgi:hypothetical protein